MLNETIFKSFADCELIYIYSEYFFLSLKMDIKPNINSYVLLFRVHFVTVIRFEYLGVHFAYFFCESFDI